MANILVKPQDKLVSCEDGESVFTALSKVGIHLIQSCGACASCGECVVKVLKGEEHLSKIEYSEHKLLGNVFYITKERLACQLFLSGDIEIDISRHLDLPETSPVKKTIFKKDR